MKRIYIAIAFLMLAAGVGALEYCVISSGCDRYIERLDAVEGLLENGQFSEAHKMCVKSCEDFENYTENGLFYFYNHDSVKEIGENLTKLGECIRLGKIDDYVIIRDLVKKQLLAVKDKEQITLNNIF